MVTIPLKTRLEADGVLHLRLPTGLAETDVEVLVVVQPVETRTNEWPEDFFQDTYGAFADRPIERADEAAFEGREVLN